MSLEVKIDGDVLHLDADPTYSRDESTVSDYEQRIREVLEQNL